MRFSTISFRVAVTAALVLSSTFVATAQETAGSTASIMIEQQSPVQAMGTWTLIYPGSNYRSINAQSFTVKELPAGHYSLFLDPPQGTTSSIIVHGDNGIDNVIRLRQYSFDLSEGQQLQITVSYHLTLFGKISVASDPPGIPFVMEGPEGYETKGTTPQEFMQLPIGNYSVQYLPEGCDNPPGKSGALVKDSRIDFTIKIVCSSLKTDANRHADMGKYITVTIDGKPVTLDDVPQSEWYATFVYETVKVGILSGYRDEQGMPTGKYGPGNFVTLAELAKISHRLADIDENEGSASPETKAQWFLPFIASAQRRNWVVYTNGSPDPQQPATRAEVVATLLQALDVLLRWPKGQAFTDVHAKTAYASVIETAALEGLVEGSASPDGPGKVFRPDDQVNRAELAKILYAFIKRYKSGGSGITPKHVPSTGSGS